MRPGSGVVGKSKDRTLWGPRLPELTRLSSPAGCADGESVILAREQSHPRNCQCRANRKSKSNSADSSGTRSVPKNDPPRRQADAGQNAQRQGYGFAIIGQGPEAADKTLPFPVRNPVIGKGRFDRKANQPRHQKIRRDCSDRPTSTGKAQTPGRQAYCKSSQPKPF